MQLEVGIEKTTLWDTLLRGECSGPGYCIVGVFIHSHSLVIRWTQETGVMHCFYCMCFVHVQYVLGSRSLLTYQL